MRKIEFKNPDATLYCGGQVIHQGNITPEKYDELVKFAPGHADHFIVTEVAEKENKPAKEAKIGQG
jgi:hypothetical protein